MIGARQRVAAAGLLLLAMVLLVAVAWEGMRATDQALLPERVERIDEAAEQLECVERQVRRAVSRVERVALDPALHEAWASEVFGRRRAATVATVRRAPPGAAKWRHRLPEFVFPRGRLVDDVEAADAVLSVRSDRGPGSCRGVTVVVRPGPSR